MQSINTYETKLHTIQNTNNTTASDKNKNNKHKHKRKHKKHKNRNKNKNNNRISRITTAANKTIITKTYNINNYYYSCLTHKRIYCPETWFQPYKLSKVRFRSEDMYPPDWRQVSIYGGIFI